MHSNLTLQAHAALTAQLKRGLLREVYQHKLVTEEQYIQLSEQQRGR